eukprot:2256337-Prymnesium_polylepis.2
MLTAPPHKACAFVIVQPIAETRPPCMRSQPPSSPALVSTNLVPRSSATPPKVMIAPPFFFGLRGRVDDEAVAHAEMTCLHVQCCVPLRSDGVDDGAGVDGRAAAGAEHDRAAAAAAGAGAQNGAICHREAAALVEVECAAAARCARADDGA